MGYCFSLETANIIANLTFGKVYSCLNEIKRSNENRFSFLEFLDTFEYNMHTKDERIYREIDTIRRRIRGEFSDEMFGDNIATVSTGLLETLKALASIFGRCKIKTLLLPRVLCNGDKNSDDDFMISNKLLHDLVTLHPGDSCLILQPKNKPSNNEVSIFDAFPNFEIALRQIDAWPAVFIWDNNDSIFVPVKEQNDVYEIFKILKYERNPLELIKRMYIAKKPPCHYYVQLSDLHFGTGNTFQAKKRLESLVGYQMNTIDYLDNVDFVITGDVVDSPSHENALIFQNFVEFLQEKTGRLPICILGNHDISHCGLSLFKNKEAIDITSSLFRKERVYINRDRQIVFLLFNSNMGGILGKGKIGSRQLSEMGNQLDAICDLEKYTLIAILHHHVIQIPKCDLEEKRWYKHFPLEKLHDETLKLIDADLFFRWLKARNVKLVLHGHKHLPYMKEKEGILILSCGSSTGKIKLNDANMTCISYNIIKLTDSTISCSLYAEEIYGAGAKDITVKVFGAPEGIISI